MTMKHIPRTTVFVVGAGFSKDLGYPLTHELLPQLIGRIPTRLRKEIEKVVRFHHPTWDGRSATLPEIEELLTEWSVNEELLPSLRRNGPFTVENLRQIRKDLLLEIASWFHQIHKRNSKKRTRILSQFLNRLSVVEAPIIISFNWDYELDKSFFDIITPDSYGVNSGRVQRNAILKPHGSLNWYPAHSGRHIRNDLRIPLWEKKDPKKFIYCFSRWRAPHSNRREYVPWIVPPTHLKNFRHPMLKHVWKQCVKALGNAREVHFLGYSLPLADWHSRYIFRCGFHNQLEGVPLRDGSRKKPVTPAIVYVVNPDKKAFQRIETVVGQNCEWVNQTISDWLKPKRKFTTKL